ncbi:hypothetical protein CSC17_1875 [Klebsiella oxytoca]|nr:hypothetical protein CSC17_1875 [Klebsiella oxytoca]EUC88276.1 hypothetical protein HMPREF1570_4094 [Klebsiella oxytoca KA-2]EUC90580.1 hypothetical protein HMPREF1569_5236 [Klebsiella oxytoca OK-1]
MLIRIITFLRRSIAMRNARMRMRAAKAAKQTSRKGEK